MAAFLAFSFGATLINQGHGMFAPDDVFKHESHISHLVADAGKVINVFLAILIGSFSLALLAPEMQGTLRFFLYRDLRG